MEHIEQQAVQTYQSNMAYFAAAHPQLHHKVKTLEAAIESGQFSEQYALEYINGYFDVKAHATQRYLYGSDTLLLAKEAARRVTFKKDDQVIETFRTIDFSDGEAERLDTADVYSSPYSATAKIIHYINRNMPPKSSMKILYKYIFLGIGLGVHLREIKQKAKAPIYCIIENDIELFRLSLFVTDYRALSENSVLYFSVSQSGSLFKENFEKFMAHGFIHNHYLKYFSLSPAYAQKIKEIQSILLSQPFQVYPYERLLDKSRKVLANMHAGYSFLNISTPQTHTPFSVKPVLFIAAGPSLNKNSQWLKENHERFVIVAVFAALKSLEKIGVAPDLIIHIDENLTAIQRMLEGLTSPDFIKDARFIFAASSPQEMLELFNQASLFLIQDLTRYKEGFGGLEIHSVGEAGYALMLLFGAQELYLLGLDLALDAETGATHASEHIAVKALNMDHLDQAEERASLTETTLRIKGNFEPLVPTTPLLHMSVHRVNAYTQALKKSSQHIYNLCDGAFFNGTLPTRPAEVHAAEMPQLERASLQTDIAHFLQRLASRQLTPADRQGIAQRRADAHLLQEAIASHAQQNFVTSDSYIQAFGTLVQRLITPISGDRIELSQILTFYTQSIAGHITDLFNTKELGNTKRHIKKIDKILVEQLQKIIDTYRKELEKVDG